MNVFAWNITISWKTIISWLDFDYVESLSKTWNKVVFIYWETKLKSSKDLVELFTEKLWELINYDLSISWEDKIKFINWDYEEWIYELVTFEWESVDFDEICERFWEFEEVISIREAEISEKFWNKVIKVDFVF